MIKTRTLDCGVRIVMEQITYVKSISMGIFVRTGSRDENLKYSGISHFVEHMMFKGTNKRTAKQIAEDVDRIGGNINAYTAKENTCYHIKTLSSNADKAIEILLDMFLDSRFDTSEMNKERLVIFEEMSMIEDTPEELAYDAAIENLFKGNPIAKSLIGTRTTLNSVSRKVLTDYISKEYTKDSIVISIAGNFDEDHICELFDRGLSKLIDKKPAKLYEPKPHIPAYTVRTKDIEQSHIMLATRGINLADPRFYTFALLNSIMGGTMSSRLFQNVREQKGLAYSVYSMMPSYTDMGAFCIYAGVSHKNIRKAIEAIKCELSKVAKDGVTEDELIMAKEQLKGNYIYSCESVNHRMLSIGKDMLLLNRMYESEEVIKDIDKVTLEDIKLAIESISDISNYSAGVVTNKRIDLKGYMQR